MPIETSKPDITPGFSTGDDEKVIEILHKWDGGRLSTGLFTELARIIPVSTVETVILRQREGKIQVLLIPRPADDIVWKGMLHSPGASVRWADINRSDGDPLAGVFERIQKQEIMTLFAGRPEFIGMVLQQVKRGPEVTQVFLAQIDPDAKLPLGADWYDVDTLDKVPYFITHQLKAINLAKEKFVAECSK